MLSSKRNTKLLNALVGESYIRQSTEAESQRAGAVTALLSQRQLPRQGWSPQSIELFLHELSGMDTNNFPDNCGAGEREGRVFSSLVRQRHFGLAHGIGRSGDVGAIQPKAAGSSVVSKCASFLAADALRIAGFSKKASHGCLALPVATGMAMTLCLLSLRAQRPNAKYVLWSRVDQKSCLKAITAAALHPVVIRTIIPDGQDGVTCDIQHLQDEIARLGAENILAVLSNSSAFAPRVPDPLPEIADICRQADEIPHIVNNAFGTQSKRACGLISEACERHVTAIVQSMDKNFMVPVGGAIVTSPDKKVITALSQTYPGRASVAPLLDLVITLLEMGAEGYQSLLEERMGLWGQFNEEVANIASKYGGRLLQTKHNLISLALSLPRPTSPDSQEATADAAAITRLGSMLFARGVSGARAVTGYAKKDIVGIEFTGWGSHVPYYPVPYLTLSCAIGMTASEMQVVLDRLGRTLREWVEKHNASK